MAERGLARILHGDVPTLFEAPLAKGDTGDVVLLGVPYEGILVGDRHTLYPPGSRPPETFYARFGADEAPDAIRRASVIYSLEHEGGIAAELDFTCLSENLRIVDAGNHTLESAEAIARETGLAGGVTVALGGDHLVPLPLIRGLQHGSPRRLGVVIFDSHLDLHPSPPLWAGSQWRTLIDEGHLRPSDITIIGPRGVRQSSHEIEYARQSGVRVITLRELDECGFPIICKELGDRLKGVDAVYISLDIDVVDPSFCPAQKYPDAAGLTPREILSIMRKATATVPIAGFDLCCFSPRYDENQRGALLAARFALEAVYACLYHGKDKSL
jgi:arginase family enzyme